MRDTLIGVAVGSFMVAGFATAFGMNSEVVSVILLITFASLLAARRCRR